MTDKELLDRLGTRPTARRMGVGVSVVSHWKHRGIPWRHRVKIAEYAGDMGIDLSYDFLRSRDN